MNWPPPTRSVADSFAVVTLSQWYAHAAVMRPGNGFTIDKMPTGTGAPDPDWVSLRATRDDQSVTISIHRDGIPALIAHLQENP